MFVIFGKVKHLQNARVAIGELIEKQKYPAKGFKKPTIVLIEQLIKLKSLYSVYKKYENQGIKSCFDCIWSGTYKKNSTFDMRLQLSDQK